MRAYLGLGANLGEPAAQLRTAVRGLATHAGVSGLQVSSLYRTRPVGGPAQPDFFNAAAALETELTARQLLELGLALERAAGRTRGEPGGPRVLDIDVLLVGEKILDLPGLIIPHPRMCERAFVLLPLAEIAPAAQHPLTRETVSQLAERVPADGVLRLPGGTSWSEGGG